MDDDMNEIEVTVTVRFSNKIRNDDMGTVEWIIDKLGEDVYNIGFDYEDLHVRTHEVERRWLPQPVVDIT